ncbi:ankyrin repeat protein [Aspergillus sp. HF37]|nr:ankyrin repeat protein [Aspergillus sp. HF37]
MGHDSTVRALLERGANVNKCEISGDALQAAAIKGHLSVTRVLLQNKADVNNVGGYYGNPLQAAAYQGHRDVAEALLDAGALAAKPGRYKDAFRAAAEAGQAEIISLFLDRSYRFPIELRLATARSSLSARSRDLLREASLARNTDRSAPPTEYPTLIKLPLVPPTSDFEEAFRRARGNVALRAPEEHAVSKVWWNSPNMDRNDALEAAASKNNEKVVQLILEVREQLNIESHHIGQALWAASKAGRGSVIKYIVSITVDLRSYIQGSLKRAAWCKHIEVLGMLLEYEENRGLADEDASGSEFNAGSSRQDSDTTRSSTNRSALSIISSGCRSSKPASVMHGLLLVKSTEALNLRAFALEVAAIADKPCIIETLYENFSEVDGVLPAFHAACQHDSRAALECLIRNHHGNDLSNEHYCDAFKGAVMNSQKEVVQYLLDQCPGKCIPGNLDELFVKSAHNGYLEVVKHPDPEVRNHESYHTVRGKALSEACARGHREVAEFLIHASADVNAVVKRVGSGDEHRWPRMALQEEAAGAWKVSGKTDYVQFLVEKGVDVNRPGHYYGSALSTAARFGHLSCAQLLIEAGADANIVKGRHGTPLQAGIIASHLEIVRTFVRHGIDGNLSEPPHGPPMYTAEGYGNPAIVKLLVGAGAETSYGN